MPQTHTFWDDNNANSMQHIKYESSNSNDDHPRLKDDRNIYTYGDSNLNFATGPCSEDESEFGSLQYKKNKVSRQDPMSHRIIEKRRRDRMNNCLADLSRLIPTEYLKKGRGRIEKTEIIEMAIQYMKHLQQLHVSPTEHYRLGYQECMSEAMRFLIEIEGHFPREPLCVKFLGHLQKHCESLSRRDTPTETAQPENHKQQYQHKRQEPNNNEFESVNENDGNLEEKQYADNGSSYKYKTDIKIRFTQDAKQPTKSEEVRRSSVTSSENFSSSLGSPPTGYEVPRTYENDSPAANVIPRSYHFKTDVPRKHPQTNNCAQPHQENRHNFNVPIFVLHTKGTFYVPTTIDYFTLLPFLQSNILEVAVPNSVLHPVTINVNFQPFKYKDTLQHEWK